MTIIYSRSPKFFITIFLTGIITASLFADDPDRLLEGYLETGSAEFAEKIRNEFSGSSYEKFCNAWDYLHANNEMARKEAEQLVEDHPEFAPGHFVLGTILLLGFNDYAAAQRAFDRSIEIDPEFFRSYKNRGISRIGMGDYEGALEDFNRVLKSRRGYAEGFLLRGVANYGLGDREAMKADFEIGIQLDYKALSAIPGKLADEAMDESIESAPDNAIYYYARGYSGFVTKNYRAAAADFRKCIELVPGSSDFYKYSGACRMHLEDFQGGQKDLNYALSVNPDDPETYYYLAVLMNDFLKQPAMAYEYMNHAIDLDSGNQMYFYERSRAAYRMLDYQVARDDINKALALDRTQGDFYALRGNIKMKLGSPPGDYCPDFKKAIEWGTSYNLKRVIKKSCN